VLRGGLWGGFVGTCVAIVGAFVLTVATNAAIRFVGLEWHGVDAGTGSLPGFFALGLALFAAARVLTPTVAARAGYAARMVRWLTMPVGGALTAAYALVIWNGPLNWLSVIALVSLPVWWIAGAWHTSQFRLGVPYRLAFLLAAAVIVSILASALVGTVGARLGPGGSWSSADFARVGAPTPASLVEVDSSEGNVGGYVAVSLDIPDKGLLAGWTDLRIETWRGGDPRYGGGLDRTETAPFLTSAAVWSAAGTSPSGNSVWYGSNGWPPNAATLTGILRLDRSPGVGYAWFVLTGVAPDGVRYLLSNPSGSQVFFNGSVLDWFEAVLAGR
jgi:hypothetical protein